MHISSAAIEMLGLHQHHQIQDEPIKQNQTFNLYFGEITLEIHLFVSYSGARM